MIQSTAAVSLFNSTVRTLLMAAVVGGVGYVGFQMYTAYSEPRRKLDHTRQELNVALESLDQAKQAISERDQTIANLDREIAERDLKIDKLAEDLDRVHTAMRLLKLQRRLARIHVLEQTTADDGTLSTTIRFVEVGDEGQPVGEPAELTVEGDRIYVEYLVVKFSDRYVEQADLERGTAICLLERIFGENQEPHDGYVIDRVGSRPNSYERGSQTSDFEQKIWDDFWTIANDRERAAELGIRAIHAQAPSIRVKPGSSYELDLRSTGEFTLRLAEEDGS